MIDRTPAAAARVGIQSADRLRREALAEYLQTLPTFTVVGRVARYDDVVSLCALEQPAIVLLDAGRNVSAAIDGCRLLRDRCPDVCLALVYEELSPSDVAQLRDTGVEAVVPYAHGLDAVVRILHKLAAGTAAPRSPGGGLSRRQHEILLLLASGHSATEIADLLRISPGTVENHKRRVYAKLRADSAVQAVARATSFGIINGHRAAPLGPLPLPSPLPADQRSTMESDWVPLVVVAGEPGRTMDLVQATLIARRLPVLRDTAPSWTEPTHAVRWHRGPVVRILVDPAPDHWRVSAAPWRGTVVIHNRQHGNSVVLTTFANGGAALLAGDRVGEALIPVLTLVNDGYVVLDGTFARPFLASASLPFADRGLHKPALTAREQDILRSIGRSLTVRQTARTLGIAVKTVENTQGHLFRKLGVHNRAEALAAAYSLGLLTQ